MDLLKTIVFQLQKKVKASSLTEVLVATTIIALIFGITIITLNNVLQNSVAKKNHVIQTELTKLQYLYKNKQISIPFYDEYDNWNINIQKSDNNMILFEAVHKTSKKKHIKKLMPLEIE